MEYTAKENYQKYKQNISAVHAGKTDRLAAVVLDVIDEGFVDLAREDHLNDLGSFFIRDAQTVDKFGLFADLLEHIADLGAAAVHEDDLDTDELQQNEIAHNSVAELFIDHGVAAVFDDNDLAVVFLEIGERLRENERALCIGMDHGFLLIMCGNPH